LAVIYFKRKIAVVVFYTIFIGARYKKPYSCAFSRTKIISIIVDKVSVYLCSEMYSPPYSAANNMRIYPIEIRTADAIS
jgi:hypothetical protein